MRRVLLAALLCLGVAPAAAQQVPFDMSPERPGAEEGTPPPPTPDQEGDDAEEAAPPPDRRPAPANARRQLLPYGDLMLAGESASRGWALHLTAAQASSAARLHLGYRNAVVAAPESSRLQLVLNNAVIVDEAVRSADGFSSVDVDIPAGLLHAGRNELRVTARHRHRTDCTIASTYELWTEISGARTFLSFADPSANAFVGPGDLRALAPDAEGRIRVEIVAPAMERNDMTADLLLLAQAVALHVNRSNLEFSIAGAPSSGPDRPSLRVLLGSADELSTLAGGAAGDAQGSFAGFLPAAGEVPTFVVSGRDREEWAAAITRMLAPVDRAAGTRRDTVVTEAWQIPDAPMIYEQRSLTFAELGIASEEFSGRRYMRSFAFAIPPDFYAGSYGEARLLLDAAYSAAVLPGSAINVYVNGSNAASTPLTERGGAILQQFPVKVTMRHFRPGLNEIAIEADLVTAQDEACLPGASASDTPRFAMFDTSRFVIPDFGRIGQLPNLAATAGTGYPYSLADEPVAIMLDRDRGTSLSAAANVLARIAMSAGRSIPVSSTISTDAARARDAIFIGAINSLPPGVLAQVGIAEESRATWLPASGPGAGGQAADRTSIDDWRRQMNRPGLRDVEDWFSRTFGITIDMMRFAPGDDEVFTPSPDDTLLVAQGVSPAGNGVWTVIAAPTGEALAAGACAIADHRMWSRLSGRVSAVGSDMETVTSKPVATFSFVQSQEPTLGNYRLIAANWLSANILSYSLLLVLACVLLGIGTSGLLSRLGRRR